MNADRVEMEARQLRVDYGRGAVFENVDLRLARGELVGLLGRNGSGKTTLLRALLGLVPEAVGHVSLDGEPLAGMGRAEIARRVAWVPQEAERAFAFRVREVVAMGRNPHLGRFGPMDPDDHRHVDDALETTELVSLAERPIPELSGGEWRRVLIARALAQDTPILLLDEPTANLDLAHQLDVLALLRSLAQRDRAVIASLHDLSQAARWCDRLVVLSNRGVAANGPAAEVLTRTGLAQWFGVDAELHPGNSGPILGRVEPLPRAITKRETR